MIEEVTPPVAWKIFQEQQGVVLLDVRSRMEYEYVGHPSSAVNVPWKDSPDWQIDPLFVERVRAVIAQSISDQKTEDVTILALCRSGARSLAAAEALTAAGFNKALNVAEGFEGDKDENSHRGNINGWRFHGLPWEQS